MKDGVPMFFYSFVAASSNRSTALPPAPGTVTKRIDGLALEHGVPEFLGDGGAGFGSTQDCLAELLAVSVTPVAG